MWVDGGLVEMERFGKGSVGVMEKARVGGGVMEKGVNRYREQENMSMKNNVIYNEIENLFPNTDGIVPYTKKKKKKRRKKIYIYIY